MGRRIAVLAFAALAFSASAPAALSPGQKMAADALIKQFSAAEFDVRQKAVDALVALGPDAAPLVKKALAGTADNEVKLRCEMVLKALREKFGIAAVDGTATPAGAVNYDASRVTLDVKDAPLSEVLKSLAQQSGNTPVNAGNFADRRVTVSVKDVPYWQALDRVLEQAGLCYVRYPWRGAQPSLVSAKPGAPSFAAYSGPAVVWIDRVTRTTSTQKTEVFRTDTLTYAMPPSQRSINFTIRAAVEDRLGAKTCNVRFTKALAPDGTNLLPKTPEPPAGIFGTPWTAISPSLYIPDTPEGIKGPLTLEGVLRLSLPEGRREVKVEDVFADGRKTAGDEDMLLEDVVAERRAGGARVSLTLKAADAYKKMVSYNMPEGYGFALVDPEGKKRGDFGGWSSTGEAVTVDFRNVPEIPGKWSLLLVWPERAVTKEYPFTIRDVPLP